jgi:hypothetical protein
MKNLKGFIIILSVTMVLLTILIGSCSAQTPINYLKIKGEIKNSEITNVVVLKEISKDNFEVIENVKKRNKYYLRLDTKYNYLVFFTSDKNITKKLEIQSGKPGMWIQKLNIDFNADKKVNAKLVQDFVNKNYSLILS